MREADVPEGMLGNVSDKEERGGGKIFKQNIPEDGVVLGVFFWGSVWPSDADTTLGSFFSPL